MKKLWTDLHSNIHHNQMDELDKWTEHAKEVLDFWPIAYYPFQMIKTESGAGLEDLCPEEEIKKDWEIVRGKVKEENANGYPMFMGYEWQGCGFDGDHNVFFLDNEQDMKHPMRYQELRDDYKDTEAIGIPHHVAYQLGSRGKNWATHDENFSPFAEIYSSHGCSENDTGGIIGVIPNVAGILFGEKDYVGIRVLCKKMLKYSYIVLAVIFVLIMLFTEQITIMFGGGGELGREMVHALRIFALCVVPYLWNKFTVSYYESIEETAIASFVTFLENAVAVLPATFIGISIWKQIDGIGTNGIGAAFVATEIITLIAAWIFRKIKHKNSTFYIVPDQNPGINFDFSIKSTMEEAGAVNRKILEFCKENGVSGNRANLAAVCAEEMTVNIIKFGGKTSNWIDINLCLEDDICQLRIRDNGVNFNPLEYSYDHEEFDIHGIELVKKISKSMDYIRAIDMNNTIISF